MKHSVAVILVSLLTLPAMAQEPKQDDAMKDCPMHAQQEHHDAVESHGDKSMGFPHDKTTHHFRMAPDGGAIEVTANDGQDEPNIQAIRSHLSHLAIMFGSGDFSTPMLIHDGVPPGATTMKLMKATIRYSYEEISSGGKLRLQSTDAIAVAAIHDFIRFQITEHQTGDRLEAAQE